MIDTCSCTACRVEWLNLLLWDAEWRVQWWHSRWFRDAVVIGNRRSAEVRRLRSIVEAGARAPSTIEVDVDG